MGKNILRLGLSYPAGTLAALAFAAIALCASRSLYAQSELSANVSGDWIAVFGDSVSAGTLALHLNQDASGNVSGQYQTTLGGQGIAVGRIGGNQLSLTLAQTQAQCPGSYRGSVTLSNRVGAGTFTGQDCLGAHNDGTISIQRKGTVAAPPAAVPHDDQGNVIPYTVLYENGQAFWICRSESAFLAVAGSEIGGYFRLTVLVGNATAEPVTFFPEAIQVTDLNTGKALPYTSPEKIAQRIEHRLAVASALMAFGNGLQAYSNSMVTVHTTGTLSMFDNHGSWAQGNFYGTATARVPVDSTRLRAENAENSAMIAARANRTVAALTSSALRLQTLAPGSYLVGNVMFPRAKIENMKKFAGRDLKSYYVKVLVPVGADNFVFLFPVELLRARTQQLGTR
ncbi:MAG: hypothetical protein WAM85_06995 [Terracidiphilus sp.]